MVSVTVYFKKVLQLPVPFFKVGTSGVRFFFFSLYIICAGRFMLFLLIPYLWATLKDRLSGHFA